MIVAPLKNAVEKNVAEFDGHHLVMALNEPSGLRGFIAIHRGGFRHPSFGATRFWRYDRDSDALRDALNLSRLMSFKSAIAGLKYGGAKAVLIDDGGTPAHRRKLLMAYARKLNFLGGHFMTGSDMGIERSDVVAMSRAAPFFVGLKVDPSFYTGVTLGKGIDICLEEVFGTADLAGRTFAIEGLGKIGQELLKRIYGRAGKIHVTDIDAAKIRFTKKLFPDVIVVESEKIRVLPVDIYAPCAVGGVLARGTLETLRCKIVAGGANNQLESPEIAQALHERGILYAPDYIVNAGGLIGVTAEYEARRGAMNGGTNDNGNSGARVHRSVHRSLRSTIEMRIMRLESRFRKILEESRKTGVAPALIADRAAEKKIATYA